ncbi:hypothetical protein M0R72_02005 [Candidatus Pacearchaeota archaeon]|nr:hypothetical protein [Candidatus Pacearchaeota archaeon]
MTDEANSELTLGPQELKLTDSLSAGTFAVAVNGCDGEIIKIKDNGDIFVKGNLITNDMEVVEGFKEFFRMSKSYNNAWYDTAAQMSRNADYYRGLVVQIGKMLGDEAYISDDGSVQDEILCAKIPELVAARLGLKLEE